MARENLMLPDFDRWTGLCVAKDKTNQNISVCSILFKNHARRLFEFEHKDSMRAGHAARG